MDKRPPNPRRLSRKLFAKKPEIEPSFSWNVPKYALGETTKFKPLRSDIGSIEVKPGMDYATYDLFISGVKKGYIPDYEEYTRKKKTPTYEEYSNWRKYNLGRREKRIRQGATKTTKWIKADKDDPDATDFGSGPEKMVREETKGDDYYRDAPLLQHEIREAIKEKKEELDRDLTKKEELEVKKGLFAEDREEGKGEAFSLSEEKRNRKATRLHEAREGMTRAQQRKLGRVIRDGKTGPMTRTRKEGYEEEEKRNTYDAELFEPVRYDYKKNKGTLTYMFGLDEKSKDMMGEREELREEYDKDLSAMAELEKKYKALREENKALLKGIVSKEKIAELTKKGYEDKTHPSYIEKQKGRAIETQGPLEEVRKWVEFPYGSGKIRKDKETGKNVGFDEFNINKRKYHAYLKKQGLRPPSKIDSDEYYVKNPKYSKDFDKEGEGFLGFHGVEGATYKDRWGWKSDKVEKYEKKEGGLLKRNRLFDEADDTRKHVSWGDEKYTGREWGPPKDHKILEEKHNTTIPASINVFLTPEQRKEFLRNAERIKGIKDTYKGVQTSMEEKHKEYKTIGSDLKDLPKQQLFSHSVSFDTKEGMEKAIAEMREKTKDYGLVNPALSKPVDRYFSRVSGDREAELKKKIIEKKSEGWGRRETTYKIPSTPTEEYKVNYDMGKYVGDPVKITGIEVKKKIPRFFVKPKKDESLGGWYGDYDTGKSFNRAKKGVRARMVKDYKGHNPLHDEEARRDYRGNIDDVNTFLEEKGLLKFEYGDSKTAFNRKMPEGSIDFEGKKYLSGDQLRQLEKKGEIVEVKEGGAEVLKYNYGEDKTEWTEKGKKYTDHMVGRFYRDEDGKIRKRRYRGKERQKIKKFRKIRRLDRDVMNNPNFQLRVARGKGRRVFHMEEGEKKGWKEVGVNRYAKQAQNWKALDVDTTPASQLQLRGLRDRRTHGARLIGRGIDPRRLDRSKEYRSARSEALIQMRINETAGVRDAKSKAEKDIKAYKTKKDVEVKAVRDSEAVKALNLKLAKETAEKTTEALKARNAGITHSYNVNVRNQTAATLLGSNPDELNKLLKKGGGLSLVKAMVRKGEISDVSTIGQLNVSAKQKENLMRLLNQGGTFVEGQEYFFRLLDEFGQTKVQRGYLNKGGERKDNLELMYIQTLPDGSNDTQRYIVPKDNILKPDDHTSTTSSGKRQPKTEPRQLSQFELDLFGEEGGGELPEDVSHFGQKIEQDPKTGVKSLVKSKGAGIADPSPKVGGSLLDALKEEQLVVDTMGADLQLELDEEEGGSGTSEEGFEFGGDAPTEFWTALGAGPEPEPTLEEEDKPPTPYGIKPKKKPSIDDELDIGAGMAEQIADELGGLKLDKPAVLPEPAALLESHQLQQLGKEGPLKEGMPETEARSPKPPKEEPKKKVQIKDEVAELFDVERTSPRGAEGVSSVPSGWKASKDDVPESVLKEDWDMRARGRVSRFAEGGSQHVPEGHIAVWTTKWAPKDNQTILLVNEGDIYHLMRGLRRVSIKNDKGRKNAISDTSLKSFYRKILEGIRSGRKEIAFNNQQLLRGLDMIDPYSTEEEESE